MSIKVLTSYDFNKNEIFNTRIGNASGAPAGVVSADKGYIYFDSTANKMKYYDGSAWQIMDSSEAVNYIKDGNALIKYINGHEQTAGSVTEKMLIDRLQHNSLTIGETEITLGTTATNLVNASINNINFIGPDTGEKTLALKHASLTVGGDGKSGDVTIQSSSETNRMLTLSGSVELKGSKSVDLATDLVVNGTKKITLTSGSVDTVATLPSVASLTLVGVNTEQNLTNKTINGLTLVEEDVGFTISGGAVSKTLTLSGNTTLADTAITLGNAKSITSHVNTTFGAAATYTGNLTIRSSNSTARTLTLENSNLTLSGSGTKLTVNDTPTISGTGTVNVDGNFSSKGTENTYWRVGKTSGTPVVYLKPIVSGTDQELQLLTGDVTGDSPSHFANLRVKDLYVEGTTTTINSNEVNIGDNIIVLNSDVTQKTENQNSGIEVNRYSASEKQPVQLIFNETSGKWETDIIGSGEVKVSALQVANKIVATFGNGSATSYVITHNLNTIDAVVMIRETSGKNMVMADVEFTSNNTITIRTTIPPTTNQYTVTIIG